MSLLRAALGLAFFCALAWGLSSRRDRFPWRVVFFGIGLQFGLALLILRTRSGRGFFDGIAAFFMELIHRSSPGAELVFGDLAKAEGPAGFVFAFAGTGLVVIIVFSALMSVLYHLGVMQVLIWALARVMTVTMGVSGAESLAMAANIFVGQTEAPLVIKPYLPRMTNSELNALMVGGFANTAGSVLAVYMGILGPEIGPHLLAQSVMSAPAAFVLAKILQPETEEPVTGRRVELKIERDASNLIEAAANGTQDGLKLWLNVIAMLIAFFALVMLVNWPLEAVGRALELEGGLSLARIFGWVFAPVAWLMGVHGWHDSQLVGSLLGTQVSINEFVAYTKMAEYLHPVADAAGALSASFEHERSAKMAAYALCGFANFSSVGIQIGGITPLAPERRADIARLALRAMLGGACASWMTATIAGAFLA
jgi:CNT family concentrative nucleoside transporter